MATRTQFTTVWTEGGLLPADLLARVAGGDRDLDGLTPEAYHLAAGERLNEAITRAWNRLTASWATFRAVAAKLPETDPGTSLTRERWLLILFQELGYGRLPASRGLEVGGKAYPVSHLWQKTPIHLVGLRVDLDRRTAGVAGAARTSPHGLLQELLTRSPDHLWGFVSNGLKLRLLRDNASLTRQAFVEFDLEAMMEGEVYADFVLLWLLAHQSRVEGEKPEECWLERWARAAREQGTRALDRLRDGVEAAITALGRGFLAHPANTALRDRLRAGTLSTQDYYRQLLRLVYRLLFLFVAEDRDLLLDPKADPAARDRYTRFYSTARLRRLAERTRGTRHPDCYRGLRLIMERLGSDAGYPPLGLPALGSFLWSAEAIPDLAAAELANHDLVNAVRALAFAVQERVLRPVDYKNLGSEELGSVYESLLELHPEVNADAHAFELTTAGGHERKTTGSYYTPASLIQCLLDSALDPVLEEAARKPDPERAILGLKVCDPACGSGHFLIAAAHRIARRLAAIRTGDEEPSPEATRTALRDVIGHCLYGVDVNPMAAELCKVSLWMEALEPGKPLSFLEHRILCGNSLLGATPALLAQGIPDEAFEAVEGDDKKVVTALRRENRKQQKGQRTLLLVAERPATYKVLTEGFTSLDAIADDSITGVREKESRYRLLQATSGYEAARLIADAWCGAFVWRKTTHAPRPLTQDVFFELTRDVNAVPAEIRKEVRRLAAQCRFFHWHLAFPDVFRVPQEGEADNAQAGWSAGFDVVLGNPPWERIKIQEKEWFATVRPDIAAAPNAAARRRMIAALAQEDPAFHASWLDALREADGESHLVRHSGRYPLCGRGDINTYALFAETNRLILGPTGRVGCIVPTGIATDDTTKEFFQDLVDSRALVSLYSFFETRAIFVDTDSRNSFCLLTLRGRSRPIDAFEFVFFADRVDDLQDEWRRFTLTPEHIALLNPNTRTCPIFRSSRDAELTKALYRRVPVLIKEGPPEENPWGIRFMAMFHMANDSGRFRTRGQLERDGWRLERNFFRRDGETCLPLYEAKMIHHFDHRFGDYADYPPAAQTTTLPDVPVERLRDPHYAVQPRYWVTAKEVDDRLAGKWDRDWLFGWRDICRATDERTVIATVIPRSAVGDKFLLLFPSAEPRLVACLLANLTSFVFDYVGRQKLGGTSLKYFTMKQLAALPPAAHTAPTPWSPAISVSEWLLPRVIELAYTAWDLAEFARDCGHDGPPFRWEPERRFLLRCELDAAFFHRYGLGRDEIAYVMGTFPIVRRNDEQRYGEYRTKRVILDIYDAMQTAVRDGHSYRTLLDPAPADPRLSHAVRT